MYSHPQRLSSELTRKLRNEAGLWLRSLREGRGLTQRDLAAQVQAEHWTFVSQLETGRCRIPPDRYLIWADTLGIDRRSFVRILMSYYDPVTYGILFESPVATVERIPSLNGISSRPSARKTRPRARD